MTRENLLQAIYDNMNDWSCQSDCPHTMEEENPQEVCMECANNLLAEYEKQIRTEAIDEFVKTLEKRQAFGNNEFEMGLDFTDILEVAKQLKERKLENE